MFYYDVCLFFTDCWCLMVGTRKTKCCLSELTNDVLKGFTPMMPYNVALQYCTHEQSDADTNGKSALQNTDKILWTPCFSWNACLMSRSMRFHSRIFMIAIHDFHDFIFFRSLTFGFKQSINSRCLSWIIFMPRNNLTQLYKIISNFPKIKRDLGSTGQSFIRSAFLGFVTS